MKKLLISYALFVSAAFSSEASLVGKTITDIEINGLQDDQLKNAEIYLQLEKLKNEKITEAQSSYVNYLIEKGVKDIVLSQEPYGFYDSVVKVRTESSKDGNLRVIYDVKLVDPVRFGTINTRVLGAAEVDKEFRELLRKNPLRTGDNLNHQIYEAYKAKFGTLATTRGYFEGEFTQKRVRINPDTKLANVDLEFSSGDRYKYGDISFKSRNEENPIALDDDLLHRFVKFKKGQPYDAADLNQLQQDLQGSEYFSEVLIGGAQNRQEKTASVETQLTMNKNKHYVYGIGYSTDSGVRGKFEFDRRWINRRGHQLSAGLYASQKTSSFDATYKIPAQNPSSDFYYLRTSGTYHNDAYKSKSLILEGGYNYTYKQWTHHYSLATSYDNFHIGSDHDNVRLLYPRAQLTYTDTNNLLMPDNGLQARAEVLGGSKAVLSTVNFAQTNFDLRFLHSIAKKHRIITRFSAGATWTENYRRLPPRFRYFEGGDKSIRGYAFEKIGSRDDNGVNIGGRYKAIGSVEYEYYVTDNWAIAAFVDAGDAYVNKPKIKVGAGVGMHWKSPVGPIKLDLGHGFDKDLGDPIRLHLTIGAELDL